MGYFLIFIARFTDVSMATVRMLMIVKGKRLYAALIGFFEVIIYVTALRTVVSTLDDPLKLLFYAAGFASGNYLGSILDEKLAMGSVMATIISKECPDELADVLRASGFGLTLTPGLGREGDAVVLTVLLQRKRVKELYKLVQSQDSHAFIAITDTKDIRGGYFAKMKRK